MSKSLKAFLGGVLITLFVVVGGYSLLERDGKAGVDNNGANGLSNTTPAEKHVVIQSLPPLYILSGDKVAFEGKTEIPQPINGTYAEKITIINFAATGENAHKSAIKIIWEDGTVQLIPAGNSNMTLTPSKRAKAIIIVGYSMHERKIFKDSARSGNLTWDIRYEVAK